MAKGFGSGELNWRSAGVVGASLVGLTLSSPAVFSATLAVFMKEISADFDWSRTAVSGGQSVALSCVVLAPLYGLLIDRVGPRAVIIGSTLIYGAAVTSMGWLGPNYAIFLALAFVVGLTGGAGAGPLGYLSLLSRWFNKRLGASIGLANMGIGVGAIAMPFLAQYIVAEHGWRTAYMVLGALILCIATPTALALVRNNDRRATGAEERADVVGFTAGQALRTPLFWSLGVGAFLVMAAVGACATHLFPMLTDRGMSTGEAARIVGLLGVSVLFSRLAAGILLDFVPSWILGSVIYLGVAIGAGLFAMNGHIAPLLFAVVLIGSGQGVEGDLLPYIVRRHFGLKNFAAVYGLVAVAYSTGAASGPLIAAQAFDRTGSYAPAFVILGGMAVVAAILMATFVRVSCAKTSPGDAPLIVATRA